MWRTMTSRAHMYKAIQVPEYYKKDDSQIYSQVIWSFEWHLAVLRCLPFVAEQLQQEEEEEKKKKQQHYWMKINKLYDFFF